MKKNLKILFKILLYIPSYLIRLLFFNELAIRFIYPLPYINKHYGKKFISFIFRDKIPFIADAINMNYELYGLIIQGPIVMNDNFTINTINYYLRQFPGIKVVLSTWNHEYLHHFEEIKNLTIINNSIMLSELENNLEFKKHNINFQIISTYNGLLKLKDLGVEFVIKSRTDFRFYDSRLILNLNNFSRLFDGNRKKRILLIDHNSIINLNFHLDDSFQFGTIEELLKFWDVPLFKKKDSLINEYKLYSQQLGYDFSEQAFLYIYYLSKMETFSNLNHDDYLEIAIKYFIMIPKEVIGTYWIKYQIKENWSKKTYYESDFSNRVSFSDWLDLELKIKDKELNPLIVKSWK